VALDSAGNIYLRVGFSSVGYNECFIAKLNPSGTANSVTFIGGESGSSDATHRGELGSNIYLAGGTASGTFPASSYYLNEDVHRAKPSTFCHGAQHAATPVFSYYFGGSGTDAFYGLAVDPRATSIWWETPIRWICGLQHFRGGSAQTYLVARGAECLRRGVQLSGCTGLLHLPGGSVADEGFAIAVDADGNAYVTGAASQATSGGRQQPLSI